MTHTLLIGSTDGLINVETSGTCFLVSCAKRVFIVTCIHVLEALKGAITIAVPARLYVTPRSTSEFISIDCMPTYHPDDSPQSSSDIAVMDITDKYHLFVAFGYEALRFEELSEDREIALRTKVAAEGYSLTYLGKNLDGNSSSPLAPERRIAVMDIGPLDAIPSKGIARPLIKKQFARCDDGAPITLGASGGPVFRTSDGRCVGVLAMSVELDCGLNGAFKLRYRGGAVVPSSFVRETILHSLISRKR